MPHSPPKLSIRASITRLASKGWQLSRQAPLQDFIGQHFERGVPCHLPGSFTDDLPATGCWFKASSTAGQTLNDEYLVPYSSIIVGLERTTTALGTDDLAFERFSAPFGLFLAYAAQKLAAPDSLPDSLYLAQHDLRDLPAPLMADLPTPDLVRLAGKGDVYASSIWLGIPPTRTPLHKDPNPNLFVQLAGKKIVKLLKPDDGKRVFHAAKHAFARGAVDGGSWGVNVRGETMWRGASESMRGDELMGLEGKLADSVVWDTDCGQKEAELDEIEGFEATLEAGDGLFIPQGWWHSVRGVGSGINASVSLHLQGASRNVLIVNNYQVNWWFR